MAKYLPHHAYRLPGHRVTKISMPPFRRIFQKNSPDGGVPLQMFVYWVTPGL